MKSLLSLLVLSIGLSSYSHSQDYVDGYFNWENPLLPSLGSVHEPMASDAVDPIGHQGEYLDFSGGYQLGETVADFTVWSGNEESFTLSQLLEESASDGKYTILFSGSNSCIRFTDFWNGQNTTYAEARQFVHDHINDFNWKLIYGHEAHPIDILQCASNCPQAVLAGPSGIGEFQHPNYQSRLDALNRWTSVHDGSIEIPDSILSYTPGIIEPSGWLDQDYTPGFPEIASWPDNTNNLVYDSFFMRPFGLIVLDCNGVVVARADWMNAWMIQGEYDSEPGIQILADLLENPGAPCAEWTELCMDESLDSDSDSYCDDWEAYNGTIINDPCSPDGTDNDADGLCNIQEDLLGTDPNDEDSDGDGVSDLDEVNNGTDPLVDDVIVDGIEELAAEVTVFPNPSNGVITVRYDSGNTLGLKVFSLDGRLLHSEPLMDPESTVELSNLTAGTYLIQLTSLTGELLRKRIVIK